MLKIEFSQNFIKQVDLVSNDIRLDIKTLIDRMEQDYLNELNSYTSIIGFPYIRFKEIKSHYILIKIDNTTVEFVALTSESNFLKYFF